MQNMVLMSAIRSGNVNSVTAVLNADAQVTSEHLPAAIQQNDSNMVFHLLEHGAQVTSEHLPAAIQQNNANMTFSLVEHGAQVTPECLLAAIQQNNSNMVCGLLMYGDYKILTKNINPIWLANLINTCASAVRASLGEENITHTLNSARSYVEIRKNSRMLSQGSRDTTTFFSKLSDEINVKIIAHTRDDEAHDEEQATKIACEHFCKPQV